MIELSAIDYAIGDAGRLASLGNVPLNQPFSEPTIALAQAVSAALFAEPETKRFPELIALAYWLRKANIKQMASQWVTRNNDESVLRLPRGTVFHIAPANVDTIFVYSWFLSLLAGNRNVMRLSTRVSPPLKLLETVISETLAKEEHQAIRAGTVIVRYDREDNITGQLSAICDTRIIWGGDATINSIRKLSLKASANEAVFPNRHGLAVIETTSFLAADLATQRNVARLFALDSFVFGQAACSSPRVLCWVGSDLVAQATKRFWPLVSEQIRQIEHGIDAAQLVSKRIAADRQAIAGSTDFIDDSDTLICRLSMSPKEVARQMRNGIDHFGGLFFETAVDDVSEILRALTARTQTLTYWGISRDKIRAAMLDFIAEGPLRVVPIGNALDFSHQWDGYDFFDLLMRKVPVN